MNDEDRPKAAHVQRPTDVTEAPGQPAQPAAPRQRIALGWASHVVPEQIRWLWTDRLPQNDLAVLAGEPGLGKSTTTTELAAQVTRGTLEGALHGHARTVLIASAEDHFESVVWGRLKAAGADLRRVANVETDRDLLAIPGDVDELTRVCQRLRDEGRPVGLIVVDPIGAFLGGVDSHKDAAVRSALAPLAQLAQTQGLCVLVVAHLNKSLAGKLIDRISGSGAFGAAPRSVLAFARDPDDPDGEQGQRRVIVHAKSNHGRYAPTLEAHIEAVEVEEVGSTVSRLVIDGESDISPDDLRPDARDQSGSEDVRDAIIEALVAGARPSREVKQEVAQLCGVVPRTVERAARKMAKLGELTATRAGYQGFSTWALAQLRHDELRHGVATEAVATAELLETRALARVDGSSSDTHAAVSLLEKTEPGSAIGYENRCNCADGGEDGDGDCCGRCYGHRGPL